MTATTKMTSRSRGKKTADKSEDNNTNIAPTTKDPVLMKVVVKSLAKAMFEVIASEILTAIMTIINQQAHRHNGQR